MSNGFQIAIDGEKSLDQLIRRLERGKRIKARIVLCINEHTYLLRIFGYNMICRSDSKFNRFDEVEVEVVQTEPRLGLRLVDPARLVPAQAGNTDIII